jgi:hypothetical protein
VPPFAVAPGNADRLANIERSIFNLSLQRNEAEARAKERERDSLKVFQPWIIGSSDGRQRTIQFHTQMLTDFKTIENIGAELLRDLAGKPA